MCVLLHFPFSFPSLWYFWWLPCLSLGRLWLWCLWSVLRHLSSHIACAPCSVRRADGGVFESEVACNFTVPHAISRQDTVVHAVVALSFSSPFVLFPPVCRLRAPRSPFICISFRYHSLLRLFCLFLRVGFVLPAHWCCCHPEAGPHSLNVACNFTMPHALARRFTARRGCTCSCCHYDT
ncbi:hypothetical protein C8R45DRAFT_380362 [Mycena sanguinolenta]|nr:hypothetical protein C8R45DRAFT_380362 [Mycena sanguinolenta]